jgi:hypothetical protein
MNLPGRHPAFRWITGSSVGPATGFGVSYQIPMSGAQFYYDFRIDVRPSPGTNDHEVRFFADGEDLIARFWDDMMGLDPDDILVTPCPLQSGPNPHRATIARCSCGVIGCGSIEVEVVQPADFVEWRWGRPDSGNHLRFLAAAYDAEVDRALRDTTWETPDRTAARLLAGKVNREILTRHGFSYSWASGRIRKGTFTVSLTLEPGPYQVLVHLPWKAESPAQISDRSAELLTRTPATWAKVEWFPQRPKLGPPPLAGPTWRQGGI